MGSVAMADLDDAFSPRQTASAGDKAIDNSPATPRAVNHALDSISMPPDSDAQATVTDFNDFTEYLPSDMTRSLTLIGKLDQNYFDASTNINTLTKKWQQLPNIPLDERPSPVQLRAQISENLGNAVSARVYSHAEATRMADNIVKHYIRAQTILGKLKTMLDVWPPPEEQKSPVATTRSPQMTRTPKITLRADGSRVRRQQVPRITVPGEVLAPYELNYETYGSDSESDSDEVVHASPAPPPARVTPAPQPRIKLVKAPKLPKTPKTPKPRVFVPPPSSAVPELSTSKVLAKLQPPPENTVPGTSDAPWLQLTTYELARLRKRMKKNAAWAPSDTMIARELKILGRGMEEYNTAKRKAEQEGKLFEDQVPVPVVDNETGATVMPPGALSMEAMAAEEKNLSNRGSKPNEAKKSKRQSLAKLAAEEAEASARKMYEAAKAMFTPSQPQPVAEQPSQAKAPKSARQKKRKRDSVSEAEAEKPDSLEVPAQRPQFKRTKTETPVPHPQLGSSNATSQPTQETPVQGPAHLAPNGSSVVPRTTPVPLPIHGQDQSAKTQATDSPASTTNMTNANTNSTASAPVKSPTETPIPPPVRSATPILPPVRETRKSQAARMLEQQAATPAAALPSKPPSRGATPAVRPVTPAVEPAEASASSSITAVRRPASRGAATSQEPLPYLAAERPRRTSTARNTPAPPESAAVPSRPPSRRQVKRPAPGVISRTNSGGNSAVGRRKAAPKKRSAAASSRAGNKKDVKAAGGAAGGVDAAAGPEAVEVEVDDEGIVVDPNEPRYCLCNRVSFGMMLACDNDVSHNHVPGLPDCSHCGRSGIPSFGCGSVTLRPAWNHH